MYSNLFFKALCTRAPAPTPQKKAHSENSRRVGSPSQKCALIQRSRHAERVKLGAIASTPRIWDTFNPIIERLAFWGSVLGTLGGCCQITVSRYKRLYP